MVVYVLLITLISIESTPTARNTVVDVQSMVFRRASDCLKAQDEFSYQLREDRRYENFNVKCKEVRLK